jgi:hypothetical protein
MNVTQSAGCQCGPHDVWIIVLTQENYFRTWGESPDSPGSFDSIQFWETEVQHNQVRLQFFGLLNGF